MEKNVIYFVFDFIEEEENMIGIKILEDIEKINFCFKIN